MKIFLASFVLLSIIYGSSGHCVKHQNGGSCPERIFDEPEPKPIHYIYHGQQCDCPKYHDIIVEQPVIDERKFEPTNYEYNIQVPLAKKDEEVARYMFDVRVEKPIAETQQRSSGVYKYEIDAPRKAPAESSIRYIFDGRIEKPVQPCQEKPWQGLVAQVDRVLMPSQGGCRNSDHTPETCDCGCRDPSHTPGTCNCGNGDYKLPIIYNSRYESKSENSQNIPVFVLPDPTNIVDDVASRRTKRDSNVEKKKKSKRREIKFPKLKPLKKFSTKDFVPIYSFDPSSLKSKLSLKKPKTEARQLRSKRKHEAEVESPCGYTYESCDPKKHSKEGCPLCYRCKCEPITKARENEKFSPYDIKIPYKFVKQNEAPGSAPMFQEFDNEPAPYTGLKDQSMYNSYIKQIISKYPEHMSRKMPDIQAQERDLLKFIDDLAKSDKSAGDKVPDEDVRYKMMDNAMDMYKFYEKAVSGLPKNSAGPRDGKYFKKRGTVLEVIEVDPNDFNESFGVELGESASEAQSEF